MKVAIFTTEDLTEHNAASLYIKEPLKYLVNFKDLEIHLIAPNVIPDELKNIGLRYVGYWKHEKPVFRFLSAFSVIPKLLREDCDLYHSIGHKATFILLIAQKIKRKKTPILHVGYENECALDLEVKINSKLSLKRIIRYFLKLRGKIALKHSHSLLVYFEALKNYIKTNNIYNREIFVVPIGINLELFGEDHGKNLLLINELGLKNKKVIMYTGEITILHGIIDLVKAVELINNKIEDVALIIVGDGSWTPMIKEYVKKNQLRNITFTGRVPYERLPYYHSIADILVIPHVRRIDSELQFPTKLLNYLASGKPIVASNLRAIADVVGDNAILVEPGNPQAFADGILKLLNNEDLAKKIGENGKKLLYKYSWEESAKKVYEAYKNVLSSS